MWPCGWCLKMACPTDPPVGTSGAITVCLSLVPPYRIGWRRGVKKAQGHMGGAFLEWALEAFSGYAAVDELYEGPYCVLSAVDNRQYKRVLYEVLDHDATHTDIEAFLGRLKTALDERGLALKGITTDGSGLYPEPIRIVFGDVPNQLCTFHMIKDLTKGVLKAVAKERERLARSKPKLKRGRPSSKDQAARRRARKSKSLQQKISDLFQDRPRSWRRPPQRPLGEGQIPQHQRTALGFTESFRIFVSYLNFLYYNIN